MPDSVESFITRWQSSGAAERANYALFLTELCDLLEVPRPDPASPDPEKNRYVFERAVTRKQPDGISTTGFIDLYKAGSFVLETKQGANDPAELGPDSLPVRAARTGHGRRGSAAFDRALERAFHQARGYITALPAAEGRPPFLIVCDVGHTLDLYAEFSGTGGHYERFPDPSHHRITLADLRDPEIRERLRLVWTDPHSLDPSRKAAEVTRDIAGRLARLARSLESDGHDPQVIAGFLQRCLFTMFAEDVGLLPENAFAQLLEKLDGSPAGFPVLIGQLWSEMATGTAYSTLLFREIACFNGGLFEDTTALPLSRDQLAMLLDAAGTDWSAVEPSIFGTLLTRALDPRERHKLGAHYTPRSYVERLVRPVIVDPLREEWESVRIAAASLHDEADRLEDEAALDDTRARELLAAGKKDPAKKAGAAAAKRRGEAKKKDAEALALVTDYHRRLCQIRVLDPACGTANFLYVTLEHLKRLEAEVLEVLAALGGDPTLEMEGHKVRPGQFLGIELNARAARIAELVLWIGYFQWHRRTTGKADTNDRPLLPKDKPIENRDAVLAYDEKIPRRDPATGEVVEIWDGHTTKPHPVTGKEVPDESARIVVYDYENPRRAEWPEADYLVGNPPFIGASRMREALGDGYTEALRKAWKGTVPESADFVMNWWARAAELVARGRVKRFGFITTNSIHQTFNRRVLEPFLADAKRPLHLSYTIPDHPWVDSADGAAVRIAMTVAAAGKGEGTLEKVVEEVTQEGGENEVTLSGRRGVIAANLQVGADLTSCGALRANSKVSCPGVKLHGAGFIVSESEAENLGLGSIEGIEKHIRGYRNGKDLTNRPRDVKLIDLLGLTETETSKRFPALYQHVLTHVKPERDQNNRETYKTNWWIFGEPRRDFRPALDGQNRYIATVETSKHRFFTFLDQEILPDNMLVAIAVDNAAILAVLSSQIHVVWALAMGGRLGMGNDPRYNKTRCFETFPFPALEEGPLKARLRELGEQLDAHRKRQQALHPHLTLTGIYNVLEKLR
ncbi:MAG: class I SAM-dependent DNA methyltransferase, partial [Verrucomicrobiae bacterium]|nr:class I SAM-dependent DNA methyltransferase [Verrucomicrobiae bacterium]